MQAKGKCDDCGHKHESGGSYAFEIADPEMCDNCAHEVENQTDPCDNAQPGPKDAKNQAERPRKLASCKKRKVAQRDTDDFIDGPYSSRITENLHDAGECHHCGNDQCNGEIQSLGPWAGKNLVLRSK